jgi:aspartate beta-hydroxylase
MLSYLNGGARRIARGVERRARPLKYRILWARLRRRASRKSIPVDSLGRVYLYLRSYYDREKFGNLSPFQNPGTSFFPGLRARALWDSREIAWTALLEQAYPQIRHELVSMMERLKLNPHPQSGDERSWRVKYFYLQGEEQTEAHRLCPNTSAILKSCMPKGPSQQVFCSVLGSQAHIIPHCGPDNTRLTCHLGLVVTPGSALRVGSEVMSWQEGKCVVFDDSFEHEAWNKSDSARVVLLIQFWHPDLTEAEVWALQELRPFITRGIQKEYKKAVRSGKRIGWISLTR